MAPLYKRSAKGIGQRRKIKVKPRRGFVTCDAGCNGLRVRIICVIFMLAIGFSMLGGRLAWVSLVPPVEPRVSIRDIPAQAPRRGNIYDRHGVMLATTLKVYSLYADPKRVLDAQEIEQKLLKVLPGIAHQKITRKLTNKKRRFVWLARHLTPAQAHDINHLGLPGLGFREEYVRIYPHKSMASHIVGAVNRDGVGLAGIERRYNTRLAKGGDVTLTVDGRLQASLRQAVAKSIKKAEAKAGWGVVMHPKTGDILSLVSLPDYDPNHFGHFADESRMNRVTMGTYEMGSTFKLFTLAQGLEDGHITPETEIDCRYPLKIGKYEIKDYHAEKRVLTAKEVMRYSSNIGASQIADMSGAKEQKSFYKRLGFLDKIDTGLPEIGRPQYPTNWGRIHTMTISFGHGMAVTPLHMVTAVSALSGDGYLRQPRLVMNEVQSQPVQVVQKSTVSQVRELMRDVVHNGSGFRTKMMGLDIGGKTGTAEKVTSRGYSDKKNLVSFVGAVPLNDPELVVLIMLDEPKQGYHTGGRGASPAFKEFVSNAAPLMALQIDENALEKVRLARAFNQRKKLKRVKISTFKNMTKKEDKLVRAFIRSDHTALPQ